MAILNKDGENLTLEQILTEVNKGLDVKLSAGFDNFKKTGLADAIKAQVEPVNASLTTINEALARLVAGSGGGGGNEGKGAGGGDGKVSPEVNAQLRNLTDLVKNQGSTIAALQTAKDTAEKRAEETDRFSTIRSALNGLPFVNDKAAETAFAIVSPHVRRLDDNTLVAGIAGDNFPVPSFTKDYLEKEHSYLFKASGAGGSGAPINAGGPRMGTKFDTASIKVGMSASDRQAAADAIANVLQSQ